MAEVTSSSLVGSTLFFCGFAGKTCGTRNGANIARGRCAATRVNLLTCWEKCQSRNTMICRCFASSSTLQQTIVLPSHGRGRRFDPSISRSRNCRKKYQSKFVTTSKALHEMLGGPVAEG